MKQVSTGTGRAVSPVVGIALLVAITVVIAVVLGSVAGAYILQDDQPPNAAFTTKYCNDPVGGDTLAFTHQAGETIETEHLEVRYEGVEVVFDGKTRTINNTVALGEPGGSETLEPGERVYIGHPGANVQYENAEIDLIWMDTGQSKTLTRWKTEIVGTNQSGECSFPAEATHAVAFSVDCDGSPPAEDRGHGNECEGDDPDNPGKGGGPRGP